MEFPFSIDVAANSDSKACQILLIFQRDIRLDERVVLNEEKIVTHSCDLDDMLQY